ncbi:MAG: glycosyltransferase family 2 protein [Candidatus Binatia bacterium]
MQLSVVIPCFNAAPTIGNQLEALCRQEWSQSWEVVVADNGSTDGTGGIVETYAGRLPGLRMIDASDRRGAAHARNAGARVAQGQAIVFCDADDEVGLGWLAAMGDALSRCDFAANRIDFAKLNPPSIYKNLKNAQGGGLQRVAYPPYLPHAGGGGLGVKRAIHERVGGFDESLPYLEDTDYCFRIQLSGFELHFVPEAVMHVRFSSRPGSLFRQARMWAQYNVLMNKRYGGGLTLAHPWKSYVQTWRSLIGCAARVFRKESRLAWMKTLGTQIGLLQGAIRHRTPPV